MILQQMRVLPLLSRCQRLAKTLVTCRNCNIRWHHTSLRSPYAITILQHQRNTNHIQTRTFFSYFNKQPSPEAIREKDKVESHYELVYTGNSIQYVRLAKGGAVSAIVIVSSFFAGGALGLPFIDMSILAEQPVEIAIFSIINSFILLGMNKICHWYPLRIYYSEFEDQFVVVILGKHPFATRTLKINPGDVKSRPPSKFASVIPWTDNLYSTPTQILFINEYLFKVPVYYNMMLGYVEE